MRAMYLTGATIHIVHENTSNPNLQRNLVLTLRPHPGLTRPHPRCHAVSANYSTKSKEPISASRPALSGTPFPVTCVCMIVLVCYFVIVGIVIVCVFGCVHCPWIFVPPFCVFVYVCLCVCVCVCVCFGKLPSAVQRPDHGTPE